MSNKAYYQASVKEFLKTTSEEIRGIISNSHTQAIEYNQTRAWVGQVENLQSQLSELDDGYICFELLIPRMGKRADVVLLYKGIIFVLEYKVGAKEYSATDKRQALGYAMDLKHFHEASHHRVIIPVLIATKAKSVEISLIKHESGVSEVICTNSSNIHEIISNCISSFPESTFNYSEWLNAPYKPTPTIVEAAKALYSQHDVTDISRSDAGAVNLAKTSQKIQQIITDSRRNREKAICFVTGVPGAGKTLVGLNISTSHSDGDKDHAVFLSGNGPLVKVLQEALAQDNKQRNPKIKIDNARREAKASIQNIHHFRDQSLSDSRAPTENVVIFDEAQRAWNLHETQKFMTKKHQLESWEQSEPEFLIGVMNRHEDWGVIIALIGGGQEINRGEAGLQGWLSALEKSFQNWKVYYSNELKQPEYAGNGVNLSFLNESSAATSLNSLHLATSMRSFRAEKLSNFVHHIINNDTVKALHESEQLQQKYPVYITRSLEEAKSWIKARTRGTESSGIIVSSGAKRLKASGIFINQDIYPDKWFLEEPDDVRSSNFLEDAASEFVVQGLELDWCLLGWDADLRYKNGAFQHWNFSGSKWQQRKQQEEQQYLENAYRVLLTRARQGMVIFIPHGDTQDATRLPEFYDETYNYLLRCGMKPLR
jgi:hypothetical protein